MQESRIEGLKKVSDKEKGRLRHTAIDAKLGKINWN